MLEEKMDRREQSKVMTSSGMVRTEKTIQQKLLPSRSERGAHQQNSQLQQSTGHEADRSRRSSRGGRGEFDPSKGRCTLDTPIVAMTTERPPCSRGVSKGSENHSFDSEVFSERETPVRNDGNSACTDSDADSDSDDDSSSSDSSSGGDSSSSSGSSSSTSSNDDLNLTASAKSQGVVVVTASLPRNNLSATTFRANEEESQRIHADQHISSSSCNAVSIDADLYNESMSFPSCNIINEKAEKKQTIEQKSEESPVSECYLSSNQPSDQQQLQSRPRVTKPSLVTGAAADSSTESIDSAAGLGMHPTITVDEEYVPHIPLPSISDDCGGLSSLEPNCEEPHQRNLVRIVLKKGGVTRGISAKKLTKNPVINIFGEIVFDGCTFEGETRSPAERAADILKPSSEVGRRELDLNSEEIRNRVCNDILQKEIRLELGEGRGRSGGGGGNGGGGGDDILQNGIRRETGERKGRGGGGGGEKGEQIKVDRQGIFGEGKVKDEGRSLLTVGKLNESRNDSVRDISKNRQEGDPADQQNLMTKRFPKRLVDYDDDDAGSGHGRSKSEDENTSNESSSRITQKDDQLSDGARRSVQRKKKRRPELSRSFSRKRRHSPSTSSSSDERADSVDGSEHPESTTSDVRHRATDEVARNCDDPSLSFSSRTGRRAEKTSDKKFSDLYCLDSQRRSAERRPRKRNDCDGSQTTRRKLASGTTTSSKSLGTNESTKRETIADVVEHDRNVKTKRARSGDRDNLEAEEKEISDNDEAGLKRRESRRSRDSLQSESRNKRKMSSPQIPRSSAKTYSPDCNNRSSSFSRHKQGPRVSPHTRPITPDRKPKSRRSETRYGEEFEARGSERRRRSVEGPDDFASGTERLEKRRRRSRTSSDRHTTEQHLDETRNLASISKSTGTVHRSMKTRSEQSERTRSRSSTAYDDDASNRQWSRRRSSTSTSLRPCPPEESCFRGGKHGGREKTRSHAKSPSPSGGQRGRESGTTRSSSNSGKVSSSDGVKRTGEDRGRTRGSKDRTDATDDSSHTDNDYQQSSNYYHNGWMWSPRGPGRLKDTPEHPYQPYPYLHPFAQPYASPMLRCNPYVYANYFNGNPRRYYMAQQPPSPFYPSYHHRPQLPYWAPPGPHTLHHPSYVPYEAPAAGQGEGGQYEEEGECQYYGVSQDENQDRSHETVDDVKSSALKSDQRLLSEDVTEPVTIQSSTGRPTVRMESEALGAAAAAAAEDNIVEEDSPASPPPSAVQ